MDVVSSLARGSEIMSCEDLAIIKRKCPFYLLVQKVFLPRLIFFDHVQYFLNPVKFFDHGQKQDFTL